MFNHISVSISPHFAVRILFAEFSTQLDFSRHWSFVVWVRPFFRSSIDVFSFERSPSWSSFAFSWGRSSMRFRSWAFLHGVFHRFSRSFALIDVDVDAHGRVHRDRRRFLRRSDDRCRTFTLKEEERSTKTRPKGKVYPTRVVQGHRVVGEILMRLFAVVLASIFTLRLQTFLNEERNVSSDVRSDFITRCGASRPA